MSGQPWPLAWPHDPPSSRLQSSPALIGLQTLHLAHGFAELLAQALDLHQQLLLPPPDVFQLHPLFWSQVWGFWVG